MRIPDVIVVGGGVIGLSIAYELSNRHVSVTVVDQGSLGREASWAGAGMLPPGNPVKVQTPLARLRGESHLMWDALSETLRAETGIDNGFRRCGAVEIRLPGREAELDRDYEEQLRSGIEVERLSGPAVRDIEAELSSDIEAAFLLPQMAQVRNPRHLNALMHACASRGVEMVPGTAVYDFDRVGDKIAALRTSSGALTAGQYVVAAGAWSRRLLENAGCAVDVEPLRGQIVLLRTERPVIRRILQLEKQYLVPRDDGRILVGSTEEQAGFCKQNTAQGVNELLQFAIRLVPSLAGAEVERTWAGLRPRSADGLPYLGRVPQTENLFVAAGHFRDGLQLSPITGKLIAEAMLEGEPAMSLDEFACDRCAATEELRTVG